MRFPQKSNTKVVTGIVRLSYANVWESASINGSNPKYSVSLIIPKSDTKTIAAINAAVDAAIKEGVAKFGRKIPPKGALKLPLRDGDAERDDEAYKGAYGRAWQRIRDRYAVAHPFCEECYKRGVLTPTEEIHHIKPLAHGGTHADDNLMALCKPCHSRITVEMGDRWPQNKEYTD